jgi:hypothetical protein
VRPSQIAPGCRSDGETDRVLASRHKGLRMKRGFLLAFVLVTAAAACSDEPKASQPSLLPTPTPAQAEADEPPPTAWPARYEDQFLDVGTIPRALAFLRRTMDVPIRLPSPLPTGLEMRGNHGPYIFTRDGQRSAQLDLVFGDSGHLIIQYGVAVLDGCAPEASMPVRISGEPGRLAISGDRWSELIWPATLRHAAGVYGIAGSLPADEIVTMARSMPDVRGRHSSDANC